MNIAAHPSTTYTIALLTALLCTPSCALMDAANGTAPPKSSPVRDSCQFKLAQNLLEFEDPKCDLRIVFADAQLGSDEGDGSEAMPFKSYDRAREKAQRGQVIILGNTAAFTETLLVKDGVSVVGGFKYEGAQFSWDSDNPTQFMAPLHRDTGAFGLKAQYIVSPTYLANLAIQTRSTPSQTPVEADKYKEGAHNYGAYILESENLTLESVAVTAGDGGKGRSGHDGEDGMSGGSGENASDMQVLSDTVSGPHYFARPAGGTNLECPDAYGGNGGQGWYLNANGDGEPPQRGGNTNASQTMGGDPGDSSNPYGNPGKPGDVEHTAEDGVHGSGGKYGGAIKDNLWVASGAGQDGTDGEDGRGGGGGGGAFPKNPENTLAAAPGGGGGAGGCGGKGGEGAGPGGASFGLFVINSEISLIGPVSFLAGDGGVGGDGGFRGKFGIAGAAGNSRSDRLTTQAQNSYSIVNDGAQSGGGGMGSRGGYGGSGGGGAGGGSYGAYCSGSTLHKTGDVDFRSGLAGRGGCTGESPSHRDCFMGTQEPMDNDGELGVAKESEGCHG